MPIIVFTYFVRSNPTRLFGKYVSNGDIPCFTGIDEVIRTALIRTLNIERDVYGIECDSFAFAEDDVDIGIISYTDDNAWTTYREVHAFDTYIEVRKNGKTRRWTKGDRLHKHKSECACCKLGGGHWTEVTI
jgi:hypothetical protein